MMKNTLYIFFIFLFLQGCSYRQMQENEGTYFLESRKGDQGGNLVVIDPGHGGKDEGCKGSVSKCLEKDLALKTAKLVQHYLKKEGIRAVLTRTSDEFVPLEDRAIFANKRRATLFVSIHYNHAENRGANGLEVYYFKEDTPRSEQSKKCAERALAKILAATKVASRGVKSEDLRVLRKTSMPAILIECGFLSNSEEESRCLNAAFQENLALAIAHAIKETL